MGRHATAGLIYPSSLTRERGKHLVVFCHEVFLDGAHEQMGKGPSDRTQNVIGTVDRTGADLEHACCLFREEEEVAFAAEKPPSKFDGQQPAAFKDLLTPGEAS